MTKKPYQDEIDRIKLQLVANPKDWGLIDELRELQELQREALSDK